MCKNKNKVYFSDILAQDYAGQSLPTVQNIYKMKSDKFWIQDVFFISVTDVSKMLTFFSPVLFKSQFL